MDIRIVKGRLDDIDMLEQFYNELNDYLERGENFPGWKKGIYPTRECAQEGVDEGNLYIAWDNGRIAGSIILNHKQEAAYDTVEWDSECDDGDVYVIHTFAVHPDYMKKGIGRLLMEHAINECSRLQGKYIRLDVTQKNVPAIRFYEKMGFQYVGTVDLGLGEYGLPWFKLYEMKIS